MELKDRVKMVRRDQRLTQTDFGRRLGVGRGVVNNLERGMLTTQSSFLPLVKLISRVFEVDEDWLLHGETSPPLYRHRFRSGELCDYLRSLGVDYCEAVFIAAYLDLDPDRREIALQALQQLLDGLNELVKAPPGQEQKEKPPPHCQ